MRSFAASIWGKVFLGVVAFTFVAFFGGAGRELLKGSFVEQTLVSVGPRKISVADFIHKFRYQFGSNVNLKQVKQFGLMGFLLESMIRDTLLDVEAERMGIIVSDDAVRIKMAELFSDDSGKFREDVLKSALAGAGIAEKEFIKIVANNLRRQQLVRMVNVGYKPSDVMVRPFYRWSGEKREVAVYTFDAHSQDISGLVKVSDDEINDYYNSNSEQYRTPEYRSFEIMLYDVSNIDSKAKALASEKDALLREYNERKDEFDGKSFSQVKEQIREDLFMKHRDEIVKNISDDIDDMIAGGKSFNEIAEELPVRVLRFSKISSSGKGLKKSFELEAHKRALSLDAGEASEVVLLKDGSLMVVRTSDITGSKIPPLSDVRGDVLERVKLAKALKLAEEKAKSLYEDIRAGKELKEGNVKPVKAVVSRGDKAIAIKYKLSLVDVEKVSNLGKDGVLLLHSPKVGRYYVFKWLRTVPGKASMSKGELAKYAKDLENILANDAMSYYMASLRNKYKVDVSKKVLDQLVGSI